MNSDNYSPRQCPLQSVFLRRSIRYLLGIWILILVSSLLYYFLWNSSGRSFRYILESAMFYINIPIFCYALLSFVASRGLFNGIRYSMKLTKFYFSKRSRVQMMDEYSADEKEIKRVLQEKYLYTSPTSMHTMPLLIAGGFTFLLMLILALIK